MALPKLTPRQRMINMMYLVLTALLALNVSKETLDVIAKVDKSLNQTIENFASKNNLTYAAFDAAYAVNPVKTGPWKFKADSVRIQAQQVIDKINQYKWAIVKEADGKRAEQDTILSLEDLNVPAQVMLVEQIEVNGQRVSRAKDLRNSIEGFHDFLLGIINPDDTVLATSIHNALAVVDPPATLREPDRSWEQDNFEYLPLIGVITLMSKMQSDIRNAESDVLNYLYQGIDEESFKFNQLRAVVIPQTSKYVYQGSNYEADVYLTAFDTTLTPSISVNGRPLNIVDGKGVYRTVGNQLGQQKYSGVINYTAPDGSMRRYPFEEDFTVVPPSATVSPTKMNVLFKGIANPLDISSPLVPAENIRATITNGRLEQTGPGQFNAYPTRDQGEAVVSVTGIVDGVTTQLGQMTFRLRRVPDPVAMVNRQEGGPIPKNVLMAQTGVEAVLKEFLFDMQFNVTNFKVTAVIRGYTYDEVSNSARFTQAQKDLISRLERNDRVYIEDIQVLGPDEIPRTLTNLTFVIQ